MTEHIHGGSIVGEVLAAHGVRCLYNLCGGHISPILHGAKLNGVTVVDLRDEKSAAFAADAAGRLTGTPGVCAVTAGPGVTNTVTAVKNAQEAQQPMIILGGATATVLRGRGSLQDIDQISLMKPITKWATRCTKVNDLRPTLERAFQVATEGVPGPVFIEIPVDVLYPKSLVAEWYEKESGVDKMKGAVGAVARLAMKGYLQHQFHMPHIPRPRIAVAGAPIFSNPFSASTESQLEEVARALGGAQKPVLVIGNQAMVNVSPERAEELAEAVRRLGIPTFLGGTSRGLLGRFCDTQFRHKRSAALKEADVVIVAGFPFDFRLGYGLKINKKACLVSINLDPKALRKNRRPTLAVNEHPGHFLVQLASRTTGTPDWSAWIEKLTAAERERDEEIERKASTEGPGVDPIHLFLRIEEQIDDDSVLIVDGGDFVATAAYIVRPRGPLRWLDPGVFGTLGVGGGFAVGAASVRPSAEVWLFYGDGSSAYSLAEFDTYVRSGYAPIAVIGTDASWQQIARDQVTILGDAVGTELRMTDYHIVAEGYGAKGILVTDASQVDDAIAEAKRLAKAGTPVCINVHLAKSDFREGSLSI
jgi:acetolactate synthase-like protein